MWLAIRAFGVVKRVRALTAQELHDPTVNHVVVLVAKADRLELQLLFVGDALGGVKAVEENGQVPGSS
jgi:hypothetical protein